MWGRLTSARSQRPGPSCQNESQPVFDEPVGEWEVDLDADLANARWRVCRCSTIETGILDMQMDRQSEELERNNKLDSGTRMTLASKELLVRCGTRSQCARAK